MASTMNKKEETVLSGELIVSLLGNGSIVIPKSVRAWESWIQGQKFALKRASSGERVKRGQLILTPLDEVETT